MSPAIAHPIPYQGSKRKLAATIYTYLPPQIECFYEPFAGSAAMSLYMASHSRARRWVIGDCLPSMVQLWQRIVDHPGQVADAYQQLWSGQGPTDVEYYNRVRHRYNQHQDPADLLYLICRCVKNSVRFNSAGDFTQSVDRRRLGMRPDTMRQALHGASRLLKGRVEFRHGDWIQTTADAGYDDFVYLDPPYLGTSLGRDKRYRQQLQPDDLVAGLQQLNTRHLRYAVSYDGMTGERDYGPPLPDHLGLQRILLDAGHSSQATLHGRREQTRESLYLSRFSKF